MEIFKVRAKNWRHIFTDIKVLLSKRIDPKQPDFISDTGIQKLCDDLGIDLMDPIILYISWKFSAEKMVLNNYKLF